MVKVESTGLLTLSSGKGRDILNFGLPAQATAAEDGDCPENLQSLPTQIRMVARTAQVPNGLLIQFHSRAIEKEPEKDATAGE